MTSQIKSAGCRALTTMVLLDSICKGLLKVTLHNSAGRSPTTVSCRLFRLCDKLLPGKTAQDTHIHKPTCQQLAHRVRHTSLPPAGLHGLAAGPSLPLCTPSLKKKSPCWCCYCCTSSIETATLITIAQPAAEAAAAAARQQHPWAIASSQLQQQAAPGSSQSIAAAAATPRSQNHLLVLQVQVRVRVRVGV